MKNALLVAILGLFIFASCNNQKQKTQEITEEQNAEEFDSVEIFVDSTFSASDTIAIDIDDIEEVDDTITE